MVNGDDGSLLIEVPRENKCHAEDVIKPMMSDYGDVIKRNWITFAL